MIKATIVGRINTGIVAMKSDQSLAGRITFFAWSISFAIMCLQKEQFTNGRIYGKIPINQRE